MINPGSWASACVFQVCMVGSLVVACVVAYIGPLPGDITRAFERYLTAALFGYIFVLTADVASRFLGGGVAAIAVSDVIPPLGPEFDFNDICGRSPKYVQPSPDDLRAAGAPRNNSLNEMDMDSAPTAPILGIRCSPSR